jgi:LacI family transcriptional regulator
MASQRTLTLGLLVPDVRNPFFTSVARGVEDRGRQEGYGIFLCNTDEDELTEVQYLNLMRGRRVDGILLAPAGGDSAHIRRLTESGTRLVLLDRGVVGLDIPSVQVDNVEAMGRATSYLLSLGHRDIAVITGKRSVSNSDERLEGYVSALTEAGVPVRDSLILCGGFTYEGGYNSGLQIAGADPSPTAILSCNNLMTTGLLVALRESGMRVPEDISVISFDDLPFFTLLQHPLTAISQPMYELGFRACGLLIEMLSASDELPSIHTRIRLPTKLVLRDSCRPLE